MDASWVAAIASAASALIVATAAIAAFLQIRHVRNANDITIYLRLTDRLDSPTTRAAYAAIDTFLEKLKTDGSLRQRLSTPEVVPEFVEIESFLRFLDNLTMLILVGSVPERLILAEHAENIIRLWDRVGEAVYARRDAFGSHYGGAFEHLAMRAKSYREGGEMERFYNRLLRDHRLDSR